MSTLSVTEAKAQLNKLARLANANHERFFLTRNGVTETVLLSIDDLEGLEITLEVLSDSASVEAISRSLTEMDKGERGLSPQELQKQLPTPLND